MPRIGRGVHNRIAAAMATRGNAASLSPSTTQYEQLDHSEEHSHIRKLWLEVILIAVRESEGNVINRRNFKNEERIITAARIYLTNWSFGLLEVCNFAEISIEDVLRRFRELYGKWDWTMKVNYDR